MGREAKYAPDLKPLKDGSTDGLKSFRLSFVHKEKWRYTDENLLRFTLEKKTEGES